MKQKLIEDLIQVRDNFKIGKIKAPVGGKMLCSWENTYSYLNYYGYFFRISSQKQLETPITPVSIPPLDEDGNEYKCICSIYETWNISPPDTTNTFNIKIHKFVWSNGKLYIMYWEPIYTVLEQLDIEYDSKVF